MAAVRGGELRQGGGITSHILQPAWLCFGVPSGGEDRAAIPVLPLLVHHAVHGDPAGRTARRMAATGAALAHAPGPLPTLRLRLPRHAPPLPGMRPGAVRSRAMRRLLRTPFSSATVRT